MHSPRTRELDRTELGVDGQTKVRYERNHNMIWIVRKQQSVHRREHSSETRGDDSRSRSPQRDAAAVTLRGNSSQAGDIIKKKNSKVRGGRQGVQEGEDVQGT